MNKNHLRSIFAVAGLSGAMALASASAYACKGEGGGHARLMRLDQNGDGLVDRAELTSGLYTRAAHKLEKADTNKDGLIDQAELQAMREARSARWSKRRGPEVKNEKRAERATARFAQLDADGDGRLGIGELQAAADQRVNKMLERLDKNGDGAISADELPARGHHRHHG